MKAAEHEMFDRLAQAIDEVSTGLAEAAELMGPLPERPEALEALTVTQRTAARAFLKAIEQLQDLIARSLRLLLIIEQEDISGMSARAIADRAVTLGLLTDSEEWSALVRLRNRLAHEYPLSRDVQLSRLSDAWNARRTLTEIGNSVVAYGKSRLDGFK